MQILVVLSLVVVVIMVVVTSRKNRDRADLTARVRDRGGEVVRLVPTKRGSPFADTGRGWWSWRVDWRLGGDLRSSWALTTREGVKEWRE